MTGESMHTASKEKMMLDTIIFSFSSEHCNYFIQWNFLLTDRSMPSDQHNSIVLCFAGSTRSVVDLGVGQRGS